MPGGLLDCPCDCRTSHTRNTQQRKRGEQNAQKNLRAWAGRLLCVGVGVWCVRRMVGRGPPGLGAFSNFELRSG